MTRAFRGGEEVLSEGSSKYLNFLPHELLLFIFCTEL